MEKKTTFVVPDKKAVEQWVQGNTETHIPVLKEKKTKADTSKSISAVAPSSPRKAKHPKETIEMKRLTIDLPGDIHKSFKRKTLDDDKTMVGIVNQWIADYIN